MPKPVLAAEPANDRPVVAGGVGTAKHHADSTSASASC